MRIACAFLMTALAASASACGLDAENNEAQWTAELASDGSESRIVIDDSAEGAAKDDDVGVQVTLSFFRTCTNPFASGVGNAATYAEASSCRRRNGTWTGFRSWSGFCTGDVSNNDGNIVCGPP